ncbi:NTP transferase domain-containing protein [Namhaeicola litoreus]|uniref:NTP transferase domain-containing protein n=1 Tax=Namhaeicola litoreus TaxID=1052145 RepID=A0ABW3Y1K4_9FLAO
MKNHRKHATLARRKAGNFGVCEMALLGSTCDNIYQLSSKISEKLSEKYKLAYIDASHKELVNAPHVDSYTFHSSGDFQVHSNQPSNRYNDKILFSGYDFLFVNGNHFQAEQQILIIDAKKEASIKKRSSQLTNVQFIIKSDTTEVFDFLLEEHPYLQNIHQYEIDQIDAISAHIENLILQEVASVNGLILVGGKSERMGKDKAQLDFHGKPHQEFLHHLFQTAQFPVYFSTRNGQSISGFDCIQDTFTGLGPFGAICSAFQKDPNKAWLVVATDLPFIDQNILDLLLQKRNPKKIATAFKGKNKDFPEPLITLWEPKAYPILLQYLALGVSCPRKVLINNDVEIIDIDEKFITNVNTPDEYLKVKEEIEKSLT